MALYDLVSKGEAFWQLMPDFGEAGKVGEASQTDDENMAIDPEWIKAGSNVLGAALGGGTSSSASSSQYVNFNNSGYTVATSGSKANGGSSIPWWGWVIAGVVAIKVLRRKKG